MEENRYSRGKIYKIVDNTNGNIYVGSTTEPTVARRLATHRSNYKSYLDGKCQYMSSYKILENGDFDIVLVENCPCDTKDELFKRERHYIETLDCVNKNIPGRTKKEWYNENKDVKLDRAKKYYTENKEKVLEYQNKFRLENKESIAKYKKDYFGKNKAHLCQKLLCECGKNYTIGHKKRHEKTNRHQNYLRDGKRTDKHQINLNKEN
jgi:hypothetical protein